MPRVPRSACDDTADCGVEAAVHGGPVVDPEFDEDLSAVPTGCPSLLGDRQDNIALGLLI
ncbi:hypothetical protein AHIS1636_35770 [Arthrobacter mangrovi]|uniref:Uncharacterized protein n=1 Tax=Arthrobacter mangrovi TaxID=2966350 RepID=A0ABQ5MYV3_9MICC|nr:hypothetical protein AHIS1636_35770 [Arthrobacter mangrovi]